MWPEGNIRVQVNVALEQTPRTMQNLLVLARDKERSKANNPIFVYPNLKDKSQL